MPRGFSRLSAGNLHFLLVKAVKEKVLFYSHTRSPLKGSSSGLSGVREGAAGDVNTEFLCMDSRGRREKTKTILK